MGPTDFNIQQALTDMEERIRADIREMFAGARADTATARALADAATLAHAELAGRVISLEEKAGWIGAGFGATVIGAAGFIWHVITHRG